MIRLLIFVLSLVLIAGTVTYLSSLDSRITGEAFGYKFDGPSGLIVGSILFLFVVAIYGTHLVEKLIALPGKIKAHDREEKRARGITALTRGLESVAVGDGPAATHHAQIAQKHLDDIALTRLLTAQAAQLSGDAQKARESYTAMLEAPETEFLALKGLYLDAMEAEDFANARTHASRAFALRPNAKWAFEAIFELGLRAGAWRETRDAVSQAERNKILGAGQSARAIAALLSADAYLADAAGDKELAMKDAEQALKRAPGFAPAAVLVARIAHENGKSGKALKTLETAFASKAHIAIVLAAEDLTATETPDAQAKRLEKLAGKNPDSRDGVYLKARAAILRGEWQDAFDLMEAVSEGQPFAHEASVIAEAIAGLRGDEAARIWFERAADAPRDPRPGVDGAFHLTRDGWARLIREFTLHDRLAPPPIEAIRMIYPISDARQLLAAPANTVETVADEEKADADAAHILEVDAAETAENEGVETVTDGAADQAQKNSEEAIEPPADYVVPKVSISYADKN